MYVRNFNRKLIKLNIHEYTNEKDMYIELWKIKYNIVLKKNYPSFNKYLIEYVKGNISSI